MSNSILVLSETTLATAKLDGYVVCDKSDAEKHTHFILNTDALQLAVSAEPTKEVKFLGTQAKLYTVTDSDDDVWTLVVFSVGGVTYVTGGLDDFVTDIILAAPSFERLANRIPTMKATPEEILATLAE